MRFNSIFLKSSLNRYCLFLNSVSVLVVLGKMRSAVGSAQLLMSQKFQQFRELCEENLVSLYNPHILYTENMQATCKPLSFDLQLVC